MSFKRKITLKTSGFIFDTDNNYDIDFTINKSKDKNNNSGKIVLYNLAEDTIKQLKKYNQVFLEAGYKDQATGLIFVGYIKEKKITWSNTDKNVILICGDNTSEWNNQIYKKTWEKNTKASQIIKDIINNLYYQEADLALDNDIKYRRGKTFNTTIKKALDELATDCNSKLFITNNKIYIRSEDKITDEKVILNSNTGLLSFNSEEENKYKITSLLNWRFELDKLVEVNNSNYLINEIKHSGSNFETELEVKPWS